MHPLRFFCSLFAVFNSFLKGCFDLTADIVTARCQTLVQQQTYLGIGCCGTVKARCGKQCMLLLHGTEGCKCCHIVGTVGIVQICGVAFFQFCRDQNRKHTGSLCEFGLEFRVGGEETYQHPCAIICVFVIALEDAQTGATGKCFLILITQLGEGEHAEFESEGVTAAGGLLLTFAGMILLLRSLVLLEIGL